MIIMRMMMTTAADVMTAMTESCKSFRKGKEERNVTGKMGNFSADFQVTSRVLIDKNYVENDTFDFV